MEKLKNISKEAQLVNWEEIKAWAIFETAESDTLLRAYPNLFEKVEDGAEEVKEEKEEKKQPAKKSKK